MNTVMLQYVIDHHGKERQAKIALHLGVPIYWVKNTVRSLRKLGILPKRVTLAETIRSIAAESVTGGEGI
jgi:predicted transcriptional regulator